MGVGSPIPPSPLLNTSGLTKKNLQAVGGAIWHGVKGFKNSPSGERSMGALTSIKARAPVLGGNFGVWGGLFSSFDCAVKGVRQKDDPYNAIIAGFFTGGALAVRGGVRAARNSAIGCACLLAVIEGVGIGLNRVTAGGSKPQNPAVGFPLNELWGVVGLIGFIHAVAQRGFDGGITGLSEWRDGEGGRFSLLIFFFSYLSYFVLLYSTRIIGWLDEALLLVTLSYHHTPIANIDNNNCATKRHLQY